MIGLPILSGTKPPIVEGSILKKPLVAPDPTDSTDPAVSNGAARLLSQPSATSITSSTESSAGESANGVGSRSKEATKEEAEAAPSDESGAGAAATAAPELSPEALSKDTTISQPKKPTLSMSSTGAIPKSISFDKTVVMNSRQTKDESPVSSSSELDPGVKSNVDSSHSVDAGTRGFPHKQRGDKSFFKSWKLPKIGRHRGGEHSGTRNLGVDALLSTNEDTMVTPDGILTPTQVESTTGAVPSASAAAENHDEVSADDILAKYRSKPRATEAELSNSNEVILSAPFASASSSTGNDLVDGAQAPRELEDLDDRLVMDPHNVEASYGFQDAKRKLRMMLSEADLSLLTTTLPSSSSSLVIRELKATNDLVALLKVQLAEAHNLQDRNLVAQLHETLRCLSLFDNEACRKLVRSLKEDYKRRSPYLAYLVKCRQGLLATLAHQRRLLQRMEADRRVCSAHQLNVCIRVFLERREKQMVNFVTNFREACSASDEKIALMERFLASLWAKLETDTSVTLLTANSPAQMDTCRVAVERAVVAHVSLIFGHFCRVHVLDFDTSNNTKISDLLPRHVPKRRGRRPPRCRTSRSHKQVGRGAHAQS